MEKKVTSILDGRLSNFELGASIDAFFANAGLKMKLEPATRVELRQIVETDITGLIAIINHNVAAIYSTERRIPLLLIDDMDKPDLDKARMIFHDRREIMLQPNCAIVSTVSSALFYSKEFDAIRDQALFLPNINLHPNLDPENHLTIGYQTLKRFVSLRMDLDLIAPDALELAVTYSGGSFVNWLVFYAPRSGMPAGERGIESKPLMWNGQRTRSATNTAAFWIGKT